MLRKGKGLVVIELPGVERFESIHDEVQIRLGVLNTVTAGVTHEEKRSG